MFFVNRSESFSYLLNISIEKYQLYERQVLKEYYISYNII